jgi:hypothetical protein
LGVVTWKNRFIFIMQEIPPRRASCQNRMKVQFKIAFVVGLIALMTSCQKDDDMPTPDCGTHDASTMRVGGPDNDGGALGGDDEITADSTGIVSGGDDDRDGGGIVGGGDDDKDGGKKKAEEKKP